VTTLTALTEDTIALAGAGIALFGIWLTRATGNPMYDAGAALVIGIMLMGFAVALAWENKRLIIGETFRRRRGRPPADHRRLGRRDRTGRPPDRLLRCRELLVTADVAFEPDLDTETIEQRITQIKLALMDHDNQVQKVYIEPET